MPRVGWSGAATLTRALPLLAENRLGLLALAAAMTAPALLSGRRDGGEGAIKVAPICTKCQPPSLQLLPQLKKRGKKKSKATKNEKRRRKVEFPIKVAPSPSLTLAAATEDKNTRKVSSPTQPIKLNLILSLKTINTSLKLHF